jgi:hypothetical protein
MSCAAELGALSLDELAEPAAAGRLDLHEGIRTPGVQDELSAGCQRWPEQLRLLNRSSGELVRGRCRATNLCRYCQTLYVVETVEMLTLDAVEYAPTLWVVLTAREHLTRAELTDELRHLRRVLRRRWAAIEWFVQVEFQRRGALHANLLVKGVPVTELDELRAAISGAWCERVDALPVGQWAGVIADGAGVVRYLSKMLAHGLKAEQRPPIGWRGHRTSQTRGYLVRPASVMRQEARRALRLKRLLHRGLDVDAAELELQAAELEEWELRHVRPGTVELRPARIRSRQASTARLQAEGNDRAAEPAQPAPAPEFANDVTVTPATHAPAGAQVAPASTVSAAATSGPGRPPRAPQRGSQRRLKRRLELARPQVRAQPGVQPPAARPRVLLDGLDDPPV